MSFTRRGFLKSGAQSALATGAVVTMPGVLLTPGITSLQPQSSVSDPRIRELIACALDAARTAGATYADIRLTHDRERKIYLGLMHDHETMTVGIRALVDGYWGFAASSLWDRDEMVRLGREAVHQAKVCSPGESRDLSLAPTPRVDNGQWTMPVQIDPFGVHPSEMMDHLSGLASYTRPQARKIGLNIKTMKMMYQCCVQMKVFGSTNDSYFTQHVCRSSGNYTIEVEDRDRKRDTGIIDSLTPQGAGWELFDASRLRDSIKALLQELAEDLLLPRKPVDVGRYTTVLDAWTTAQLVSNTIGLATELDRVLGYEANASGTSYLNDPVSMLGELKIGNAKLSVIGNREESGGAATVRWDDEGVIPDTITLVQNGVLTDFSTNRETASWLAGATGRPRTSARSHGCAVVGVDSGFASGFLGTGGGIFVPLVQTPNLRLVPAVNDNSYETLIASVPDGIAFKQMQCDTDFQQLNGLCSGKAFEIKRGKRVAQITNAGLLFRSPEMWKQLNQLGGISSARRYGQAVVKGEPPQAAFHSVTSVPAVFDNMTVIDLLRRS